MAAKKRKPKKRKKTPSVNEIFVRKITAKHWNSTHPDHQGIVGFGGTADRAIKDYQEQFRRRQDRD